MDDLEVVVCVDLGGGQDPVLTVDCKGGDRDHQITGKSKSVGLCEGKIVRHLDRLHSGAGQFPLDGSEKALRRARAAPSGRSVAADLHGLIVEDPDLGQDAI
ncbi:MULTISPECIES: hypothetical protein [unclassified Rhizobium]|uniref:hypothetical protein n=1 Tax=Rhizobium sp. PP-CC-3G-465 TaxID=2135648 RepID=UPI00140522C6